MQSMAMSNVIFLFDGCCTVTNQLVLINWVLGLFGGFRFNHWNNNWSKQSYCGHVCLFLEWGGGYDWKADECPNQISLLRGSTVVDAKNGNSKAQILTCNTAICHKNLFSSNGEKKLFLLLSSQKAKWKWYLRVSSWER